MMLLFVGDACSSYIAEKTLLVLVGAGGIEAVSVA